MAAIDLSIINSYPWVYTAPAVGTTWQEVILPERARVITVIPEGEDGYLGFDAMGDPASPQEPADGGVVGSHRWPLFADTSQAQRKRKGYPLGQTGSIFVARASTSGAVSLLLEE